MFHVAPRHLQVELGKFSTRLRVPTEVKVPQDSIGRLKLV